VYKRQLKDSSKGEPELPADFVDNFLLPFLTNIWTVSEHINEASAYAVLTYVGLGHPSAFNLFGSGSFAVWAVVDGTQGYVSKLAAAIESEGKTIRCPAPVSGLRRGSDGTWSAQVNGADAGVFDQLIIAAPAWNVVQFLGDNAPELTAILQAYDYFATQVAIHSDTSFMPQNQDEWCSVYQYWNGFDDYYQTTWQGVRGVNVFKTWVTYSQRQPDPSAVYQTVHFHHPDHHLAYFANQIPLAALQGRNNLWLAGSYTHGVDSHEDAIRSAINAVTGLDNLTGGKVSPNLMKLLDWTTQYAPPLQRP
jgi:predicted NAD/FAD-binding protein